MAPPVQIREISVSEIPVIQRLIQAIWRPTYGGILSAEQSDFMLNWMYSTPSLTAQMARDHRFLLLTVDDEPTGFASFQPAFNRVFKLQKIYLLPAAQGQGWGRILLNRVVENVIAAGGQYLDLNVNRGNAARVFYEKLGFQILHEEDNYIGRGFWMNDYVMRLELAGRNGSGN